MPITLPQQRTQNGSQFLEMWKPHIFFFTFRLLRSVVASANHLPSPSPLVPQQSSLTPINLKITLHYIYKSPLCPSSKPPTCHVQPHCHSAQRLTALLLNFSFSNNLSLACLVSFTKHPSCAVALINETREAKLPDPVPAWHFPKRSSALEQISATPKSASVLFWYTFIQVVEQVAQQVTHWLFEDHSHPSQSHRQFWHSKWSVVLTALTLLSDN